jgi:hypothetical protein
MACTLAPSHLVREMGHRGQVEKIWRRRSRSTWCMWNQAIDDSRWAPGEPDPPSPMRRRARSERRTWWKVKWGLDSLLVVP